jgi:hypothetical protein
MNMNALNRMVMAGIAAAGILAAQTVVAGTGNPDIDIAAVQAAVEKGGSVVLKGHFSFDNPPGRRGELPDLMATVLISNEVTISGTWDEHGQITTIDGGEIPFAVEARGATVKIERLRFVRPKLFAMFVDAAAGLAIESCIVESVQPRLLPGTSSGLTSAVGIYVSTVLGLPTLERPGNPGNVSGKLSILNNQVSVGGAPDHGIGIMIVNLGSREAPVDVDISGNTVRNATLRGINALQIAGQARVERNVVETNVLYAGRAVGSLIAGIHCGGSGSYLIAHNRTDVADPNMAGIRIKGYPALSAAIEHAIITDNDVTMSAPEGAVFGMGNSGIEISGLVRGAVVQRNRILGRARVGLSVAPDKTGSPSASTIDGNDVHSLVSPGTEIGLKK